MNHKITVVMNFLFSILTLHLLASPSMAHHSLPAKSPTPPETVCNSTLHPHFCKSLLPNKAANVQEYTRVTVLKSLSRALQFKRLVNHYLQRQEYSPLSQAEIAALEDCRFLADLNIDYLTTSFGSINSPRIAPPASKIDDIHTLLGAVLTNQHTCWEGLQSAYSSSGSAARNDLLETAAKDNIKLYGVSLSLFAKGWVPKKVFTRPFNVHRKLNYLHMPLAKISSLIRRGLYKSIIRRKLLQAGYGQSKVLVRDVVTVSKDGTGNFATINEAVDAAPNDSTASEGYFAIHVKAGMYEEYVSIGKNKKYLMIIGEGINKTVITGSRSASDGHTTTFYSATFAVVGPGFVAMDITFRNTAGPRKGQAVAVRSGADKSIFYRCSMEGYQDTLYSHSFRQYYRECDIYGTVDFIFGNAAVVFHNCNLYARLPVGNTNTITAQGRTHPEENNGISILECNIKAAADLASSKRRVSTYLGRPWQEYSRTVYLHSYMDSIVDPAGWLETNGDFALKTLYYAEHNNTGPGSNTAGRVKWPGYHVINATDAFNYTFSLVADDWVPHT